MKGHRTSFIPPLSVDRPIPHILPKPFPVLLWRWPIVPSSTDSTLPSTQKIGQPPRDTLYFDFCNYSGGYRKLPRAQPVTVQECSISVQTGLWTIGYFEKLDSLFKFKEQWKIKEQHIKHMWAFYFLLWHRNWVKGQAKCYSYFCTVPYGGWSRPLHFYSW